MPSPLFFNKDVGATLEFTVNKPDGTPYDLTGVTTELVVENVDTFTCTVTDGPAGRADYTVGANEFNAGTYRAQLKTTDGGVVLHTSVFTIKVSQAINEAAVVTPPIIIVPGVTLTEGAIPFGGPSGTFAEDAANLSYDDTNNNLKLFGGTVGTNGAKVLALGVGTAPTTSPTNSVQIWAKDDGVGAGLRIRDEDQGNIYSIGAIGDSTYAAFRAASAVNGVIVELGAYGNAQGSYIGTSSSHPVEIVTGGFTAINVRPETNVLIGGDSAVGDDASGVFYLNSATSVPSTSPANKVGLWSEDRKGDGTADLRFRTEEGHTGSVLGFTLAGKDDTERTTTSTSSVDLSTITVNIPRGDYFVVVGKVRKTAGAAASVQMGLKINGTQTHNNTAVTTATNQAEDGTFGPGNSTAFTPGETNYRNSASSLTTATAPSGGGTQTGFGTPLTANIPDADITSITITGQTSSASVTLAVKDVRVYRLGGF